MLRAWKVKNNAHVARASKHQSWRGWTRKLSAPLQGCQLLSATAGCWDTVQRWQQRRQAWTGPTWWEPRSAWLGVSSTDSDCSHYGWNPDPPPPLGTTRSAACTWCSPPEHGCCGNKRRRCSEQGAAALPPHEHSSHSSGLYVLLWASYKALLLVDALFPDVRKEPTSMSSYGNDSHIWIFFPKPFVFSLNFYQRQNKDFFLQECTENQEGKSGLPQTSHQQPCFGKKMINKSKCTKQCFHMAIASFIASAPHQSRYCLLERRAL